MTDQTFLFGPLFSGGTNVGVAIEVPGEDGEFLGRLREEIEGTPADHLIPPHITVVPPTPLPSLDLTEVESHLEQAAAMAAPFDVELAGSGTFRPTSPVVFAAVRQGARRCDALQRAAVAGPLAQDLRFDYHPHVTVAHDVDDAALDRAQDSLTGFSAAFTVTEFVLYELGPDERWHAIRTFPLTGTRRG